MEEKNTKLVGKQGLYMAILISLTLGFLAGVAFTSFKLTGTGDKKIASPTMPPAKSAIDQRIAKLEVHLKENPKDAKAWAQLGNQFFDLKRVQDAIDAYKRSLALAPTNAHVLTDLGVMYRRNKQPQMAVDTFDIAITLDPSLETARFNKGVVLMHDLEDMAGAIAAWEDLVELNPMAQTPRGELVAEILQRMKNQK